MRERCVCGGMYSAVTSRRKSVKYGVNTLQLCDHMGHQYIVPDTSQHDHIHHTFMTGMSSHRYLRIRPVTAIHIHVEIASTATQRSRIVPPTAL